MTGLSTQDIEFTAWIRRHARSLDDATLLDAHTAAKTDEERRLYWREIERRGYQR